MGFKVSNRVKDTSGNTVGFMIDNKFFTDYYVKENIDYIDNMSLLKNGVLRAKKELSEVNYNDVVTKKTYNLICKSSPFEREIQEFLTNWKNDKSHTVLQLEGSRQIGKTTELKKFAYKNYEYVIFVDLTNDIYNFKEVVQNGCTVIEFEKYCRRASLPHFVNSKNTILIIDEIQNSSLIYNSIRRLFDSISCDIIVTGSYLGQILRHNEFFLPAGTISYGFMFPLSFSEFCRVFKKDNLLKNLDLYGNSSNEDYENLNELYELYLKIGGYPEVVKRYIETNSIDYCYNVIEKLFYTFKKESMSYFKEVREVEIFSHVYREALLYMCKKFELKSTNALDVLTTLVSKKVKNLVNKKEVANAVIWVTYAGILSLCNQAIDGDMRNINESRKIYFSDCGLVSYLASKSVLSDSFLSGILTETFVYNELHRLFKVPYSELKVREEEVCFSTYGNYELDFMLVDKEKNVYGIEVKTKDGDPKSLKVYIDKRFVDKGIVVKPTKGGHGVKYDTIPIYTVGCRFPYKE